MAASENLFLFLGIFIRNVVVCKTVGYSFCLNCGKDYVVGVGYNDCARSSSAGNVDNSALILGENKNEIYSVIKDVTDCYMADDLQAAIDMGCAMAGDVDLLLLSPASASYDMFKSFEERGEIFQKLVRQRYGL